MTGTVALIRKVTARHFRAGGMDVYRRPARGPDYCEYAGGDRWPDHVRFTPESGHSHGSRKRFAYDPKRTLRQAALDVRK